MLDRDPERDAAWAEVDRLAQLGEDTPEYRAAWDKWAALALKEKRDA